MPVDNRRIFRSENQIFSVESRSHLHEWKAVCNLLHSGGISDDIECLADFRCDIPFDKVLIALHLHRAVATYGLVVVAWNRVIECIHAQVKHSVVRILVLENKVIYRSWFILGREILRSYEMILVEVTLSDRDKVDIHKEYDSDSYNCHLSVAGEGFAGRIFLRSLESPQQQSCCNAYEPE